MGCCQGIHETGEINISILQERDRQIYNELHSDDLFTDLNLSCSSETLNFPPRYTEQKECIYTTRSSNYSIHLTELEKAFLRTSSII